LHAFSIILAAKTGLKRMFILYYTPHTCSLASHITLEDSGAEYELRRIDFSKNEQQSSEYLKINAKGRVPALVTPRGILSESICRSKLPAGGARSAERSVLAGPTAGVHQLFMLDSSRRACSPDARLPVGE
jgi:hypothetical protein